MKILTHTRKFSRFILILFALQIIGCKKSDEAEIEIEQNFLEGSTYRFKVELNNIFIEDSQALRSECFFDIKFTVKDSDDGLECSWKYSKNYIPNMDMDTLPEHVRKIISMNEGLTVKFSIDDKGKYKGIINMNECRQFTKKKYLDFYLSSTKEWQVKTIEKFHFLSSLNDEELTLVLFPEILMHFEVFGNKYNKKTPKNESFFMKSPFDGKELNANKTSSVEDITDGIAHISEKTEMVKEDYEHLIQTMNNEAYKNIYAPPVQVKKIFRLNYDMEYKVLKESFCKLIIFENGIEKHVSVAVVSQNDWAKKIVK